MNILIKGWIDIYHSYAIVNYFHLKYITQENDLTIYFEETEFYNKNWQKKFNNNLNLKKCNNEKIDLIFRIAFPYVIEDTDIPQILFFTSEYHTFVPEFFNKSYEEISVLVKNKKLFLLTPSYNSSLAFSDLDVKIIPHGTDYKRINDNYRKELNIHENSKVFLNISGMTGNKNIKTILSAFEKINNNNWVLILKGNNDLYNSIEMLNQTVRLVNFDKIKNNLRIITTSLFFEEINKLYSTADVYIDAGVYEGFSMPVVEAKSCGLSIITDKNAPLNSLADYKFKDVDSLVDIINKDKFNVSDLLCEYQWTSVASELKNFFYNCKDGFVSTTREIKNT